MKPRLIRAVDGGVRLVEWSPDATLCAWATDVGGVGVDLADGFVASELRMDSGATELAWSRDSELLAVGTESGAVAVWQVGGDVRFLEHRSWVGAIAWDSEGRLAVGTGPHVIVYDDELRPDQEFPFVGGHVNALRFIGDRLAVGTAGGVMWCPGPADDRPELTRFHNPGSVVALAWDGGRMLACGDALGSLRIADIETGDEWAVDGFPDVVDRIAWCRDLVLAVAEDELTVWGMGHDGIDPDPFRLTGHTEPVTALAVRDGRIASGDEAGDVLLWPLGLLGEPLYLQVPGAVTALGWNPVEYRLSIGTQSGELLTVSDRR